ncbi:hypothetical protein C1886_18850 [Pseudomonas sp. FW300-N1A1]|nr:hypothetical protein C1886_18850 [Pseudomonas sp. FW300-N1A1]
MLSQIQVSVLTNALRYSGKAPISVHVYPEDGQAWVEVRDGGMGISEDNQKRIFQQFEQVIIGNEVAGLGLGLFICERMVVAHGGTLRVESKIDQGSLFRVCLPL